MSTLKKSKTKIIRVFAHFALFRENLNVQLTDPFQMKTTDIRNVQKSKLSTINTKSKNKKTIVLSKYKFKRPRNILRKSYTLSLKGYVHGFQSSV